MSGYKVHATASAGFPGRPGKNLKPWSQTRRLMGADWDPKAKDTVGTSMGGNVVKTAWNVRTTVDRITIEKTLSFYLLPTGKVTIYILVHNTGLLKPSASTKTFMFNRQNRSLEIKSLFEHMNAKGLAKAMPMHDIVHCMNMWKSDAAGADHVIMSFKYMI